MWVLDISVHVSPEYCFSHLPTQFLLRITYNHKNNSESAVNGFITLFVEQKKLSNDYIIYEIVYLLYLSVSDHSQGFKAFIFDTVAVVVLQICICS